MGMIVNPYGFSATTDPFWANTVLLIPFEGANNSTSASDLSPTGTTVTLGGTAKISTAVFGNGALLLDGTNACAASTPMNASVGTSPFTLEAFIRPTSATTGRIISGQDSNTPAALIWLRVNSDGSLTAALRTVSNTGLLLISSSAGTVATDGSTEYHVAFTRDGSNDCRIWCAGTQVASGTSSTNPDASRPWVIGKFDNTQELFVGNIRWTRVTQACRYTASFTPPSLPLPTS